MNKLIGFEKEFELIFENLKENKLNNSILINGNKGIGKFFFVSQIIETYINYKLNHDQINHHLSLLNNNTHPNVKILQRKIDEKTNKIKNNITIDQIRDLNNFFIETSVIENFPKFILIDSADDLNINSSNALLKILEEPKNNTYFFLISHQQYSLLPTIKSRCLKLNLSSHNFKNFESVLSARELSLNSDILKLLFDITNGSPGLSFDFNFDKITEQFDQLLYSITENENLSNSRKNIIDLFSTFENDKLNIYLSLIKFILIVFKKVKLGIVIRDSYLSKNILEIENLSNKISLDIIDNKLDYLINNQNDLFTFNLDKKLFMINFFATK